MLFGCRRPLICKPAPTFANCRCPSLPLSSLLPSPSPSTPSIPSTPSTLSTPSTFPTPKVWSGFYSSRPALKAASRTARRELMAADAMVAVAGRAQGLPTANLTAALDKARFDADVILHHDAITGTMCVGSEGCIGGGQGGGDHAVLEDYMSLLSSAMATSHDAGGVAVSALMANGGATPVLSSVYDKSVLRALQRGQRVALVLVNSELHERNSVIRLNLPVSGISFTDKDGKAIASQVTLGGEMVAGREGAVVAHASATRCSPCCWRRADHGRRRLWRPPGPWLWPALCF